MTPKPTGSEYDLLMLLAEKFPAPEYATFTHVASTTGARSGRTADAVVIGLWPSRGLDLHGIEVKNHRSDWLREKQNPEKAEEIAQYCDLWSVVAPAGIVRTEELPRAWGLLEVMGGKLHTTKAPERLDAKPLSKHFVIALLRRISEQMVPRVAIAKQIEGARNAGQLAERACHIAERAQYKELVEAVSKFEGAAGIKIDNEWSSGDIGAAVRIVQTVTMDGAVKHIRRLKQGLEHILQMIDLELTKIQGGQHGPQ